MARRHLSIKEISAELVVGIFFFTALLVLAYFTIIVSRETFFKTTYERQIRFPSVAGLGEGDSVLMRGVKVGGVDSVSLFDSQVLVRATFDEEIAIYDGYRVVIGFSSILGGRYVAIEQGDTTADLVPAEVVLTGDEPADLLAELSQIVKTMQEEIGKVSEIFEENEVFQKFAVLIDDLQSVASDVREGRGTLGKLLHDPSLYDSAQETAIALKEVGIEVKQTATNLDGAIADARAGKGTLGKLLTDDTLHQDLTAVLSDIRQGKGTLGQLISDDALHRDLKAVTARLREVTEAAANGDSSIGRLLQDNGQLYDSLLATFDRAAEISAGLKEGEGTIGKLLQDEELYDDLRTTVGELRSAVEDFREQAPISTFGSFIFGAL